MEVGFSFGGIIGTLQVTYWTCLVIELFMTRASLLTPSLHHLLKMVTSFGLMPVLMH